MISKQEIIEAIKDAERKSRIRLNLAILLLLVSIFSLSSLSYAWFKQGKALRAVGNIHAPAKLILNSGHQEDVAQLYLGSIDVSASTSKPYVFAVSGNHGNAYYLELAYTTNNDFEYAIYRATESDFDTGTDLAYVTKESETYFYHKGVKLNMSAPFQIEEYESVDSKQHNADPFYQITLSPESIPDSEVNYYILEISWAPGLSNTKETDMVYLIAGTPEKDG